MTARRSRLTPALAKKAQTAGMEVSDHVANNVKLHRKFGLYYKLVYICTAVQEDCAASMGRRNKLNN